MGFQNLRLKYSNTENSTVKKELDINYSSGT